MILRYNLNPKEISISGTKTELVDLSSCLSKGENIVKGEKKIDPRPYKELAEYLEIRSSQENLVSFEIFSGKILVRGDLQKLLIISENILDLLEHGRHCDVCFPTLELIKDCSIFYRPISPGRTIPSLEVERE